MQLLASHGGVLAVVLALSACHALSPLSPPPRDDTNPDASGVDLSAAVDRSAAVDQTPVTCDDPGWWDAAWSRRRQLTFDNTAQADDLNGFPVAIRFDPSQHAATDFMPGGQDLRFISSTGKPLPFEIESWSATEGIAWVRVPLITAGGATDHIWVYFGNPAAPAAPTDPVWDASFVGVWHLQADPAAGPVPDSSQHTNHASADGTTPVSTSGRIGRGLALDGTAHLRVPSTADDELAITSGTLTLEGWGYLELRSDGTYHTVVSRQLGTDYKDAYTLVVHNEDPAAPPVLDLRFQTTPDAAKSSSAPLTGTWQHLAGVRDGTQMKVYIDGQLEGTLTASGTTMATDAHDVIIGANENYDVPSENWKGKLDEVRISAVARDASWIAATYLNGIGKLVTYGPVQTCGGG